MKYKTRVEMPDGTKEALQAMTDVGEVERVDAANGEAVLILEAEDLYELSDQVHELEDRLTASGYYQGIVSIERPQEVPEKSA